MTTITRQPIYSPHSRATSVPRCPIRLVEQYRTVVDGVAVGFPTKVVAEGPTLQAAQSAMISKLKALHQKASLELYKLKTRCNLLECATGLSLEFSDFLTQAVMEDVRREILVFTQLARRAAKPFPQSPENAATLFSAFQSRHEADPSFAFSADNLMKLYNDLIDAGALQPNL